MYCVNLFLYSISSSSIMEYDTFVRHGIPVIGVIGNDSCWTQIARDQVPLFDDDGWFFLKKNCLFQYKIVCFVCE